MVESKHAGKMDNRTIVAAAGCRLPATKCCAKLQKENLWNSHSPSQPLPTPNAFICRTGKVVMVLSMVRFHCRFYSWNSLLKFYFFSAYFFLFCSKLIGNTDCIGVANRILLVFVSFECYSTVGWMRLCFWP